MAQQPSSVPQVSNSRLSPLPPEPAFANSAAANDATVDIPLGGAKVSCGASTQQCSWHLIDMSGVYQLEPLCIAPHT